MSIGTVRTESEEQRVCRMKGDEGRGRFEHAQE
jgi:hypothetical protein